MQPIAFCNSCRGMEAGWNKRYILHTLVCRDWITKSCKLLILTVVLSSFMFAFPISTEVASSAQNQTVQPTVIQASLVPVISGSPIIGSIERLLAAHGVDPALRPRVAQAIVTSSRRYDVEPRLVASIMIVESRANPFAISADSIGIMQIHVPTWGQLAENLGINLFKIEDNVDLGVRILKGYIVQNGIWQGVIRYKGVTADPESRQAADEYVQKVQNVYGISSQPPTPASEAGLH